MPVACVEPHSQPSGGFYIPPRVMADDDIRPIPGPSQPKAGVSTNPQQPPVQPYAGQGQGVGGQQGFMQGGQAPAYYGMGGAAQPSQGWGTNPIQQQQFVQSQQQQQQDFLRPQQQQQLQQQQFALNQQQQPMRGLPPRSMSNASASGPAFQPQPSANSPKRAPARSPHHQSVVRDSRRYIDNHGMKELLQQNEQLSDQLSRKEAEIENLRKEFAEGKLKKELQMALDDHRKFRKIIEEYQRKEANQGDYLKNAEADATEIDRLNAEITRIRTETETLVTGLTAQAQQQAEDIAILEGRLSQDATEHLHTEEGLKAMRDLIDKLTLENSELKDEIFHLKDGSKVQEMAEMIAELKAVRDEREADNEILLSEMDRLLDVNELLKSKMENARAEGARGQNVDLEFAKQQLEKKLKEIEGLEKALKEEKARVLKLENRLAVSDDEIISLKDRMADYESTYNLTDAMKELRSLQVVIKKLGSEGDKMRATISKKEHQLKQFSAENAELKKLADVSPDWGLQVADLELEAEVEVQKARALVLQVEKENNRLEQERMELLMELRKGVVQRTEGTMAFLGLDAEQTYMVEAYAERLRNGDPTLPVHDKTKRLMEELAEANEEVRKWQHQFTLMQLEKDEITARFMNVGQEIQGNQFMEIMQHLQDLKVAQRNTDARVDKVSSGPAAVASSSLARPAISHPPADDESLSDLVRGVLTQIASMSDEEQQVMAQYLLPYASYPMMMMMPQQQAEQRGFQSKRPPVVRIPSGNGNATGGGDDDDGDSDDVPVQKLDFNTSVMSVHDNNNTNNNNNNKRRGGSKSPLQSPLRSPLFRFAPPATPFGGYGADGGRYVPDQHGTHGFAILSDADEKALQEAVPAHLLGCLKDLVAAQVRERELADVLHNQRRKYDQLAGTMQALADEYKETKEKWSLQMKAFEEKNALLVEDKEKAVLEVQRLTDLHSMLKVDVGSEEYKEHLEDQSRRIFVLQVNHRQLSRRYNSIVEEMKLLQGRESMVSIHMAKMQRAQAERITELEHGRRMAEQRLRQLQDKYEGAVTGPVYAQLAREHANMTSKYAILLSTTSDNAVLKDKCSTLELDNETAQRRIKDLMLEVNMAKTKVDKVEGAMVAMVESSNAHARFQSSEEATLSVQALHARIAGLEVRETNARMKADRLAEDYRVSQERRVELEKDNARLEAKLAEQQTMYLSEKDVVTSLQVKMEGAVPYEQINALQEEIRAMKEGMSVMELQNLKYKQDADIATQHALHLTALLPEDDDTALEQRLKGGEDVDVPEKDGDGVEVALPSRKPLVAAELEIVLLKQTIRDLQEKSDDQAIIGKLNHALIQARVNEANALRLHKASERRVLRLEADLVKCEKQIEVRDQDIFELQRAKHVVQEQLRTGRDGSDGEGAIDGDKSAGLTVKQAEALHEAQAHLQEKLEQERKKNLVLSEQAEGLRLEKAEAQAEMVNAQDLLKSIEVTGTDADIYQDEMKKWSKTSRALRLSEMRLTHQVKVLEGRIEYLTQSGKTAEEQIAQLQLTLLEKEAERETERHEWENEKRDLVVQNTSQKAASTLRRFEALRDGESGEHEGEGGSDRDRSAYTRSQSPKRHVRFRTSSPKGPHDEGEFPEKVDLGFDKDDIGDDIVGGASMGGLDGGPRQWTASLNKLKMELDDAREVMREQALTIEKLRHQLSNMRAEGDAHKNSLASHTELHATERARILATAQHTISALNDQLVTKSEALLKYQQIFERQQRKFQAQREADQVEIERLHGLLLEGGDKNMTKLKAALNYLEDMPNLPQGVMSVEAVEEVMKEKDALIAALNVKIDGLQTSVQRSDEAREEAVARAAAEQRRAEEALAAVPVDKESDKLKAVIETLRTEMDKKQTEIESLQQAIVDLKDDILSKADTKVDVTNAAVKKEQSEVRHLERQLSIQAAAAAKWHKKADNLESMLEEVKAKHGIVTGDLQDKILKRDDQAIALRELQRSLKETQTKLKRAETDLSTLRKTHRKLQSDFERATGGDKKKSDARASSSSSSAADSEQALMVSKLKTRVSTLEKRLKETKQELAKEVDEKAKRGRADESKDSFDQWQVGKRLQKRVTSLKKRLDERTEQLETANRVIGELKAKTGAAEHDKIELISHINELESNRGGYADRKPVPVTASVAEKKVPLHDVVEVESLRRELHVAKNEVDRLARLVHVDNKREILRLTETNSSLTNRVKLLQDRLAAEEAGKNLQSSGGGVRGSKSKLSAWEELRRVEEEKEAIEEELLAAKCTNLELKFEQENHGILVNRLHQRVQELTQYNAQVGGRSGAPGSALSLSAESLEVEAALIELSKEFPEIERKSIVMGGSGVQAPLNGSSGSSRSQQPAHARMTTRDMADLLLAFKSVIVKLRAECAALKKSTQSNAKYMSVLTENKRLRNENQSLTQEKEAGITLAMKSGPAQSLVKAQGEVRRLQEVNEQTRASLKREMDLSGKLRRKVGKLEAIRDRLRDEVSVLKKEASENIVMGEEVHARQEESLVTSLSKLTRLNASQAKEIEQQKALIANLRAESDALASLSDELKLKLQRYKQDAQASARDRSLASESSASAESARIETLQNEVATLQAENEAYRKELSAFDMEFFDEIEDLKYKYATTSEELKKSRATVESLQARLRASR